MTAIDDSCVFIPNRETEGLVVLEFIPPASGTIAKATDTIVFDKSNFGILTVLDVETIVSSQSSAFRSTTAQWTVSSDTVTVTLPAVGNGIAANDAIFFVKVTGVSRPTHSTGGNRLFGGHHD